jgi:predicted ABC-type sugar transport system permease subunit
VGNLAGTKKQGRPANVAIAIFALGCASVFFAVGTTGGFNIGTLIGVAILALLVFGSVCATVYIVFILVTRGTALLKDNNRSPLHGGEWWRR